MTGDNIRGRETRIELQYCDRILDAFREFHIILFFFERADLA